MEKSRTLVASFGPVKTKAFTESQIVRDNPRSAFGANFDLAMKVYRYYLTDNLLYVLAFMTVFILLITFLTHYINSAAIIFGGAGPNPETA